MNNDKKKKKRWKEDSFKIVFPEDCQKIIDVCKEHDLILTEREADYLWSNISEDYEAGWLLEEFRKVFKIDIWTEILRFIEKENGFSINRLDEIEREDVSL